MRKPKRPWTLASQRPSMEHQLADSWLLGLSQYWQQPSVHRQSPVNGNQIAVQCLYRQCLSVSYMSAYRKKDIALQPEGCFKTNVGWVGGRCCQNGTQNNKAGQGSLFKIVINEYLLAGGGGDWSSVALGFEARHGGKGSIPNE